MSDQMPTLMQRMIARLRKPPATDQEAAQARAGAEKVAEKLPSPVMPMDAIKRKRQQLKDLDEQTKGD